MKEIDFTALPLDLEAEEPFDIQVDKKTFRQCKKPFQTLHVVELIKGDKKRDAVIVAWRDCKISKQGRTKHTYLLRIELNGAIHPV